MKKIIFSTMIASLLAFVGCQNEELVSDNNTDNSGKKVILTANIQGAADSRVALTPDTDENENPIVKVDWRTFDSTNPEKFKVHGTGSEPVWNEFTQTSESNKFEGTLPDGADYAYYGYTISSGALSYDLSEQDGTLNENYILMQAPVTDGSSNITFEHQTAILRVEFNGVNNQAVAKIVMDNVHAQSGSDYSSITITPAQASLGYFYIFLPIENEGGYGVDHTFIFSVTAVSSDTAVSGVTAVSKDYTATLTIPDGMSIEAGNLYTADIALTEVNYVWTSRIVAFEPVVGDGNENSPYLIHSANNLQWMIDQVNDGNSTPQLPYYRLTHDLEIDSKDGATWTPIGTSSSPFVGYFDGGGYTISGEMVTAADVESVGFFGVVNIGTVITNLTNAANITPLVQGACQVGGIVGFAKGYDADYRQYNSTYIIACHNTGTITYTNSGTVETFICLGGIAGYIHGGTCVLACSNTGGMVNNSSLSIIHGGIVGVGGTEINTVPSVVSCQTSKGTIIGDIFCGDYIRANYSTDSNCSNEEFYKEYFTDELLNDELNSYINMFNYMNYDYTYVMEFEIRDIICNWHWALENGSVVLKPGAPEFSEG